MHAGDGPRPRGWLATVWYSQPVLPSSSRTSSDAEWAAPMVRRGAPGAPTQAGECLGCAALEPGGDAGTAARSRFRVGLERPLIAAGGGAARS